LIAQSSVGRGLPVWGSNRTVFPLYNTCAVDTIRTLARERHFFTAEVQLVDYGQVLLIGDEAAVEQLLAVLGERHDLVHLQPEPEAA
jgi:hypothetical protein